MRYIQSILVWLIATGTIISFSNCGGGDDPDPAKETETARVTQLLTASSWKLQNVTVDGVVHAELFQNMSITFSGNAFTASNGDPVWPSSGTRTFTDQTARSFTRSDAIVVSIDDISASALVLSLTWNKTTLKGGKENSLSGKNVFTLGK